MIRHWKDVARKMAKEEDMNEEELIQQLEEYFSTLAKGVRSKKAVDYDIMGLGVIKPSPSRMERRKKYYEESEELSLKRVETREGFFSLYERWQKVMKVGRWKLKGVFNPFENDNQDTNKDS